MATIKLDRAVAVLKIVHGGRDDAGPISTHRVNKAFGLTKVKYETQRSRLFLHTLREAGLVDGECGRDGAIRWWKITEAGKKFLLTHA